MAFMIILIVQIIWIVLKYKQLRYKNHPKLSVSNFGDNKIIISHYKRNVYRKIICFIVLIFRLLYYRGGN